MSENNSTTLDGWVRLNVGGKIFQTTKDTLARCPESFLARLVNGELPSEKDETGALLIDRSYKHFDTILNYLRTGVVHFVRKEKAIKDLLCEVDFYNIQSLVDEIQKSTNRPNIRTEIIYLYVHYHDSQPDECEIVCSEKHDDYEVLQALRDKFNDIKKEDGIYWFSMPRILSATRIEIEVVLRNFGFVEEFYDAKHEKVNRYRTRYWKFVRTVSK
ncbi:BTB/POZ domain-containing protein [Ditylenchus destructor]|nr:BTB/POZ domain-containing protein [Ditylenchus destructor]